MVFLQPPELYECKDGYCDRASVREEERKELNEMRRVIGEIEN